MDQRRSRRARRSAHALRDTHDIASVACLQVTDQATPERSLGPRGSAALGASSRPSRVLMAPSASQRGAAPQVCPIFPGCLARPGASFPTVGGHASRPLRDPTSGLARRTLAAVRPCGGAGHRVRGVRLATVRLAVTAPARAGAARPGRAPDNAERPAWGRNRAPAPNAARPASDSETACRNRGNTPAGPGWCAGPGRSLGPGGPRAPALPGLAPGDRRWGQGARAPHGHARAIMPRRGAGVKGESREMLGLTDNLWYNGLPHSSATQTRRVPVGSVTHDCADTYPSRQ